MEKFLTKVFDELALWKIWVMSLPIFFPIAFVMFYSLGSDELTLKGSLGITSIVTAVFSLILPLFVSLYRSGTKFYDFAKEIEEAKSKRRPSN